MTPKMKAITSLLLGLLLAGCLLLLPTGAAADDGLTEAEVRAAVQTWVRYVTADARPDAVVERMEPYRVDGETVAYIAHLQGGGFCICGADVLVLPVYFYSPAGTYDPENPSYDYFLWEIGTRLEGLREQLRQDRPDAVRPQAALRADLADREAFWQDLIVGRVPGRAPEVRLQAAPGEPPEQMELDLTTTWDQNPPYNDLCPMGDGGRTVVGCVATAVAQIMKYWEWPPSGTGDHSYTWDGDDSCNGPVGGEDLDADFSDPYDWRNMPDDCAGGCSAAERAALSELSYEVGVAIEMDYGHCGSGASPGEVQNIVEDYFRYDPDAVYENRALDRMVEEVQWLRPFHFRGEDAGGGGHSWVALGYNQGTDPDQFLMNLGWGNPPGWYSVDNVPGAYTIDQAHTTRIAPEDMVRFVDDTGDGDGSPDDPYGSIEEGLDEADDWATLIFKAGSINTFSDGPLVIDRPVVLRGYNATIRRED